MKHIGIVGCSAEGAALCYKTICVESAEYLGQHNHPEVSLHTPSLSRYTRCLEQSDLQGVGALMAESANRLEQIGAELLICPDNTIHQAFDIAVKATSLPWLHIAQVVAEKAQNAGYKKIGLLGTQWLVESNVYPTALNAHQIDCMLPTQHEIRQSHQLIMEQLVNSVFTEDCLVHFQSVIQRMQHRGCNAVILGCTEIPLIIDADNSALPILDSTRLLAHAAIQRAIEV